MLQQKRVDRAIICLFCEYILVEKKGSFIRDYCKSWGNLSIQKDAYRQVTLKCSNCMCAKQSGSFQNGRTDLLRGAAQQAGNIAPVTIFINSDRALL